MKDFWGGMGVAAIIFAVCISPALCSYILVKVRAIEAETKAKRNTITITNSFNHIEKKP